MTDTPSPARVEDILLATEQARRLAPGCDQTHVLVSDGADPWVIRHAGHYYFCTRNELGDRRSILVARFDRLTDLATAPLVEVWSGNGPHCPDYVEVWAPELQIIDGWPYIYATLYMGNSDDGDGPKERIHCFEGMSHDPQGPYRYKSAIRATTDRWAIDGSILRIEGILYFIWSGWDGHANHSQNLYIARMQDPWTLASDRVCLSRPEHDWEKVGYPFVNEGPQALQRDGRTFIVYSASGSWTDAYCLGQLTFQGGDPLVPSSWRKSPLPVFQSTETIVGVGHGCFVTGDDGQDWLIYHAARGRGAAWARQIRAKAFGWTQDGEPDFGHPL